MDTPANPQWLHWCQRLQAISQTGLTFASGPFDVERYHEIREIAAEMLAQGSGVDRSVILGLFGKEAGYATPKVDVRGVVFQNNRILLVRERSDGKWTFPGGWADVGSSPAENVVREIREEAGFTTRVLKLLAIFDRSKHPHEPPFAFHIYKMFFLCSIVGGEASSNIEIDGVDFFEEDNLPELSLTRITKPQILRMFEHHRNPDLPTDFDPLL
jgi:ADP-ribose pyrophosphatase YjhB (NUDIX family)